jgi:ornithine carbamoyltransferase
LVAAADSPVILHSLPAHRGEEITDDVLDSKNSLIWEEVRHRTSAMLGVLRWMKESQ